ncbi:MAG: helix-turn-helix transcriptional regulator [Geodermatophilaceae bacterium]|nr:helix-turn-helix transcriptional regulator [Geodermatophilaceae bacterium]
MREWVPVSTSPKGRLALAAVREFGSRAFEDVTVGELAAAADVTTGALYHHFRSKLGLYLFVRRDVERRLLDRMEGAAAGAGADSLSTALVVGFDFAVRQSFVRLLSDRPPNHEDDPLSELLARLSHPVPEPIGRVLASAWRAALSSVAEGASVEYARQALLALNVRLDAQQEGSSS